MQSQKTMENEFAVTEYEVGNGKPVLKNRGYVTHFQCMSLEIMLRFVCVQGPSAFDCFDFTRFFQRF